MSVKDAASIIEKHRVAGDGLIAILEDIQATYGYLPESSLRQLAERTGRSLVDIYGVATFYKAFSLKPRGKHHIAVCLGTACHVRGGPGIVGEFERQLGVSAGETTEDREFTLETVACLGACALGPIVTVDGHYFSKVGTSDVKKIVKQTREGIDRIEIESDKRIFPVEVSCSRCNRSLMDSDDLLDGLPAIRVTVSVNGQHGRLLLSSLYGSYTVASDFPIPEGATTHFFCPHCHGEMLGSTNCPECGSQMVPMIVRGGGIIQICSKRGCKGHILDLGGSTM